jgi:hypothetical protein
MAIGVDELLEGGLGGSIWGLGAAVVAGAALLAWKGGRPLAKKAITGALVLSQRAQELAAEATEQAQDLYAEARSEFEARAGA